MYTLYNIDLQDLFTLLPVILDKLILINNNKSNIDINSVIIVS